MWTKWLELKQPYWSLRWKALVTDAGRTKRKRPGDCGDATPPLISYICMREKEMSAVLNVNILTYKMLLCYFVPPWPPTDEGHLPLDTIFFFFFLAELSGMRDLSSLTRDGTCAHCSGSTES